MTIGGGLIACGGSCNQVRLDALPTASLTTQPCSKSARRTEDVRKPVTIVDLLDRFVSDKTVAIQQITLVDTLGVTGSRSGYRLRALGR